MLGVRLDHNTEARLLRLCNETGHSKSYYVKKAIIEFLNDREDYLLGIAELEKREPTMTLKELEKELGLDS